MTGYSSLFRSRWNAVLWAGGILWAAYAFAGSSADEAQGANGQVVGTDATGAAFTNADLAAFEASFNSTGP